MKDEEHKYVRDISRRVEDMTGLTVSTAEELQVVNYGIGGHYEPHFDFARVCFLIFMNDLINNQIWLFLQKEEANAFKSLGTGNRIATVLFYVSSYSPS